MSFKVAALQAQIPTSSGTADFTISGFGTPKAAIIIPSPIVNLATDTTHLIQSFGFTDGVKSFACCATSEHNVGTTDTYRMARSNLCYLTLNATNGSTNDQATFDSWITDGIRLNFSTITITTAPTPYVTIILLGGTDLSVDCDTFSISSGTSDITAPGFEPDMVLTMGMDEAFDTQTIASGGGALFSLGCAVNNQEHSAQRCYTRFDRDNVGTSESAAVFKEDMVYREIDESGENEGVSLGSFDSNGFTATYEDSGGTAYVAYLAIKADTAEGFYTGTYTPPAATGNDSNTDPGFEPQCVLHVIPNLNNLSHTTNLLAGCFGLGVMDGSLETTHAHWSKDAVATTKTGGRVEAHALHLTNHNSVQIYEADFVSFDDDGYTTDITDAPPAANRKFMPIVFGAYGFRGRDGGGTTAAITGSGTGVLSFDGSDGSGVTATISGAGVGVLSFDGADGGGTTATISGAGVGVLSFTGTDGAGSTSIPTATGTGSLAFIGADGAGAAAVSTGTGTGSLAFIGADGGGTTATISGAGVGVLAFIGADGGGATAVPAGTGTGVLEFTGTDGGGTTATISGAGVGVLEFIGTDGGGATAVPFGTGTGVVTANNFEGSDGGGTTAPITAAGVGVLSFIGSDGGGTTATITGTGVGVAGMEVICADPMTGAVDEVKPLTGSFDAVDEMTGTFDAVDQMSGSVDSTKALSGSYDAVKALRGSVC